METALIVAFILAHTETGNTSNHQGELSTAQGQTKHMADVTFSDR